MPARILITPRGPVLYSDDQAAGAIPNHSRILKALDEPGDAHKVGDGGFVVGSIGPMTEEMAKDSNLSPAMIGQFGYWVRWDDAPGIPVFVVGYRIKVAT